MGQAKGEDPVQIAGKAIEDRWQDEGLQSQSDAYFDAQTAMDALAKAGWRIVRHDHEAGRHGRAELRCVYFTEEWAP